jgi:alpha-amylase
MKTTFVSAVLAGCAMAGDTAAWKQRSVYQVLTDRFAKSDGSTNACTSLSNYCGGTFKGMIDKLDYI